MTVAEAIGIAVGVMNLAGVLGVAWKFGKWTGALEHRLVSLEKDSADHELRLRSVEHEDHDNKHRTNGA